MPPVNVVKLAPKAPGWPANEKELSAVTYVLRHSVIGHNVCLIP